MNDHEIGMDVIKGLENQCQAWKNRVADLTIEVQELKSALYEARERIHDLEQGHAPMQGQ